ncbi:MAG TPA: Rv0340 family IniB-related protein, partial [Mycobacterium sp.]|nr:Rv0340 family IniB-related protein [Mycobacterium sp.]
MANSLLDFVMAVVRDPDTAARFAANPDQAILDANLTNVTSADVNALIPVVSESMSSLSDAVPAAGLDGGIDGGISEMAGNVWTSGA